jgi:hypothetical protein
MGQLKRIKSVEHIEGYKLRLKFSNKQTKIVNLDYLFKKNAGYYFEPLRDLEKFKEVYCDGYTICWPNEADLCPDMLYMIGEDAARPVQKPKNHNKMPKARKKAKVRTSS